MKLRMQENIKVAADGIRLVRMYTREGAVSRMENPSEIEGKVFSAMPQDEGFVPHERMRCWRTALVVDATGACVRADLLPAVIAAARRAGEYALAGFLEGRNM